MTSDEVFEETLCDFIWGEVSRMERLIFETSQDGVERGFAVSAWPGVFTTTRDLTGGHGYIDVPRTKNMVGFFHTHQPGYSRLSPADYDVGIDRSLRISCVGYRNADDNANRVECSSLIPKAKWPEKKEDLRHLRAAVQISEEMDTAADNIEKLNELTAKMVAEYYAWLDSAEGHYLQTCPVPSDSDKNWERFISTR